MEIKEVFKNNYLPIMKIDYIKRNRDVKIIDGKEYVHQFITDHVFDTEKEFEDKEGENRYNWQSYELDFYAEFGHEVPVFWNYTGFTGNDLYRNSEQSSNRYVDICLRSNEIINPDNFYIWTQKQIHKKELLNLFFREQEIYIKLAEYGFNNCLYAVFSIENFIKLDQKKISESTKRFIEYNYIKDANRISMKYSFDFKKFFTNKMTEIELNESASYIFDNKIRSYN